MSGTGQSIHLRENALSVDRLCSNLLILGVDGYVLIVIGYMSIMLLIELGKYGGGNDVHKKI